MPDPVFRGMTKTAMWLGVPIVVAILAHMPVILISLYGTVIFDTWKAVLVGIIMLPNHLVMREITRSRPQVWRQMGLHIFFRYFHRDLSYKFWQSSTYGPG